MKNKARATRPLYLTTVILPETGVVAVATIWVFLLTLPFIELAYRVPLHEG